MRKKIDNIYSFLVDNSDWKTNIQFYEYKKYLVNCVDARDRLRSALYLNVNNQKSTNLNSLSRFWAAFEKYKWQSEMPTINEFITNLGGSPEMSNKGHWEQIFDALKKNPSWGHKTAALFVKCAINIHSSPFQKGMHFFSDFSKNTIIINNDKVYLPVDSVIRHIFTKHVSSNKKDFKSINAYLIGDCKYGPDDILIWDDLWFWGHITQTTRGAKSGNPGRYTAWNPDMFRCMEFSHRLPFDDIARQAKKFIDVLEA